MIRKGSIALAHDGQPLAPHDLWSAWSIEPLVVPALVLTAGLYLRGVCASWLKEPAAKPALVR